MASPGRDSGNRGRERTGPATCTKFLGFCFVLSGFRGRDGNSKEDKGREVQQRAPRHCPPPGAKLALTHTHEDRGESTKTGQKCSHQGHLQKQKGCRARDAVPETKHRNPQERSVSHTQRKSSIGPQKVFNLLSHTQEGAGLE